MILYDYVLSARCYKVRLMAALLGAPLTLQAVNFHPGREHKSPEMLVLNPNGTLPILKDGDTVLTDSADILRHLTSDHPEWRSADDDTWLAFASNLNDSLGLARLHDVIGYAADIDTARTAGVTALRKLEAHLTEQRFDDLIFLTGKAPTIADIACFPNTALAPDGGVSLDPYPSVRLWMRAIRSLPGFIEMPGIHRLHELAHPA
ncbi:glutathione S-transferase N-terminal domain-containing protein [Marivita sp. XM-24bin2]|jgi:glutathione S-transferase|uniref:glutathione S-transferase family protein n=1 Tax=unclassified Marivita TaxID=2632480 RepID=UPI000D7A096D|nr:glutathione S-transferase N-terminal domain-containing protein [Marivita sp. XM-24bin2]MCR9107830.1 glutathione S-transferase N-terminal domain-containing protein [Paracoccaceae bacterium]PWL35833.1 MAG: glutathione S-transferase [Marivita sp. XM-24bin2]